MTPLQKKIFSTLFLSVLSTAALPQEGYGRGGAPAPSPAPSPAPDPTPIPGGGTGTIVGLDKLTAVDVDTPKKYNDELTAAFDKDAKNKQRWKILRDNALMEMKKRGDPVGGDCSAKFGQTSFKDPTRTNCLRRSGNPNFTTSFFKQGLNYMKNPSKKGKSSPYHFCPHLVHVDLGNLTTTSTILKGNVSSRKLNAQALFAEFAYNCTKNLTLWFDEPVAGTLG